MFQALVSAVSELMIGISCQIKKNFFNYNELHTAISSTILVADDGSLLSVVEVHGISSLTTPATFANNVLMQLTSSIASNFDTNGHIIQSVFNYEPENAEQQIRDLQAPSRETYRSLEMDVDFVLDENVEALKDIAAREKNYLLLWTTTGILSAQERKASNKKKVARYKEAELPIGTAANPFIAHEAIIDRHIAFVQSICASMENVGISVSLMTVSEAVREMRAGVEGRSVSEFYEPILPGDRLLPHVMKQSDHYEEIEILPRKLSQQICRKDVQPTKYNNVIRIGDLYFSAVYLDEFPKDILFFNNLFQKMRSYRMNWRFLFTITGDGMAGTSVKHNIAKMFHITSQVNRDISTSIAYLRNMQQNGSTIVKVSCALCTWSNDLEKTVQQASSLSRTVESWGRASVSEDTGNPIQGFANASMGFTKSGSGNFSCAPLEEALIMLPFGRPTSVFSQGELLQASPDGKILPIEEKSPELDTWITLISAGPGAGKSVYSNTSNFALIGKPGNKRIPLISIIDIGWSAMGLVQLLKYSLPPDKQDLAIYLRIANTQEYTVNPFDLMLMCRFPLRNHMEFLVNLLGHMMTDPNTGILENGVADFLKAVVTRAYRYYSDSPSVLSRQPKEYIRYQNTVVDNMLDEIGYKAHTKSDAFSTGSMKINERYTTWWEVVDVLCKNGKFDEAEVAQRFAVPTMHDLAGISQSDNIVNNFGKLYVGQETVIEMFQRKLTSVIANYPLFSGYTVLDVRQARVKVIDLIQVSQKDSKNAEHASGLMYLYAMKLSSSDFWLDTEDVKEMPYPIGVEPSPTADVQLCREYQFKRISEIKADHKRLTIDECHRVGNSESLWAQITAFAREGRKSNTELVLASQSLEDFKGHVREFCSRYLVMKMDNEETVRNVVSILNMRPEEIDILRNSVHGPIPGVGNTFFCSMNTKSGTIRQLHTNKVGAALLWMLSTTTENMNLRVRMFEEVGFQIGIRLLATAFKGGDARRELKAIQRRMTKQANYDATDVLISKVIDMHGRRYGIEPRRVYHDF